MSPGLALAIACWTTANAIVWMLVADWALRSRGRLQERLDELTKDKT